MFDIGWSEMAVIMLVALVVIGPKDLPRLARTVGQWVAKGRSMAREFQRSLEDMAREAELDDVKREIEKVGRTNIGQTIEKTLDPTGELGKAFDPLSTRKSPTAKTDGATAPASAAANGSAKPEPAPVNAQESAPAKPEAAAPAKPEAAAASAVPAANSRPAARSRPAAKAKPPAPAKAGPAPKAKTKTASPKTKERLPAEPH
jgi:sec-independent protein translocase protein TatB